MIRVLVVDDHPVVAQGLQAILDGDPEFRTVGVLSTAVGLGAEIARLSPDVVLLDLEMPGVDGLAALEGLTGVKVVIFTAYGDRVGPALQAGARGYLLKGAPAEVIRQAVRTVQHGGTYLQAMSTGPPARLSERERDVLAGLADGLSNKAIAARLGVTERTVKFHVNGIFNKLSVDNRTGAVVAAMERGLLSFRTGGAPEP
ncbi:MAG TPA: response regulator transcription factor [Candidatus Xenobia bacterium]